MSFGKRPNKPIVASAVAATVPASASVSKPQANGVKSDVNDGNAKRKIAVITDRNDALQRVEAGDAKRPAPGAGRQTASVFLAPPVQSDGSTPADKAMHRSQKAADHMMLAQYNIIKHFVVLDKLLQQSTTVAVVGESAADLARTGQF